MHRSRVGMDAQKPGLAREMHKAKFRAHHEKRLEEISRRAPGTGTVDNTPPYTAHLVHLKTRPKKKAILAARDAEVERANRDLLRQMTKIFTAPSALLPITDSAEGRGNGLGPCLSINVLCRKRELERIALENKTWMKHLKAVTPSYDAASWERDRAANKKVMERLRTVRYVREKATPEEFSRRGVRHLRKQVARTRGKALEAGFSPVPRLFDGSRGKRGKTGCGRKRRRRATDRQLSASASFSSPSNRCQELTRAQSQGEATSDLQQQQHQRHQHQQRQQQQVEEDGAHGIPTGVTVSVKTSQPKAGTDGGGKGDGRNVEAPAEAAVAVAEKQEADDDDGSQSVYSEFEDDGAEEAEEEGEEEQQYSEFEDEPKEEDDGDEDQFSDFGDGDGCERGDAESQGVQQHGTGNSGEATTTAEKAGDSSTFASEGAAESEQARDLASSRNDGLVTKEKKEVTETLETEAEAPGREHASSGRAEDEAETFTPQDGSSNACVGDAGRNTRTAASSTDQEDGIPNQDATSPTQAEDGSNITPTLQRDSAGDVAVERTSGGVEARAGKGGSDGVNVDHDHDHDHDSGIETRTANEANEQEGSDSSQPQPQPQPQLQQDAGESIRDGAAVGQPEPSDRELSNGDSDDRSDSNDRVDSDDRGDSDDRVDSGGGQREEHEESSVESGYKSEGFEGDGDSSESAMSGPAPQMAPSCTEETASGQQVSPHEGSERVEADAVATDPAPPSPTVTSIGEGYPTSSEVEGEDGDGSLSTPPLVDSPLPLQDQQQPTVDQESPASLGGGQQPLDESPSPPQLPPVDSGLADDAAFSQEVSHDLTGDDKHEQLREAGVDAIDAASAAAGEEIKAQPGLAGESALLARRPYWQSLAPAGGEGAGTGDGIECTITAGETKPTTSDSAADGIAGQPAAGTALAAAAQTASETRASGPSADVCDAVSGGTRVEEPRQSSGNPPEVDGGSGSLSVEGVPPENASSTGPSTLPSPGLEMAAPTSADVHEELATTAVLPVVGGGERQGCSTGEGEGEDEGEGGEVAVPVPPLDRAQEQPASTPVRQTDTTAAQENDGSERNSSVGRHNDPDASVLPPQEQGGSGRISGQGEEARVEVEMEMEMAVASPAGVDHEAAGETTDGDHVESPPQDSENGEKSSTPREAEVAQQDGVGGDDEKSAGSPKPSPVSAKEAGVEGGGLDNAPAEGDLVDNDNDNAPEVTGKIPMPGESEEEEEEEEEKEEATPAVAGAEATGDQPMAEGSPSEPPQPAQDAVGSFATAENAEAVEVVQEATPALDSVEANLEEAKRDPTNDPAIDGTPAPTQPSPPLPAPSGHSCPPPGPVPTDGGVDAPAEPENLESSGDGLCLDAGTDPGGIDDAAQGQTPGVDDIMTSISVGTGDTQVTASPQDTTPSGAGRGDGGGELGPAAAKAATAEPEGRAAGEATRAGTLGKDDEDKSHSQNSISGGGEDASTTGKEAPGVPASKSAERVTVQGEEAGTGVGTEVAWSENAEAVVQQGSDRAASEDNLVGDEVEQGGEINSANACRANAGGESNKSCDVNVFDDLSSSAAEAAKSEDGGISTSIEGPDTSISSLGGEVQGGGEDEDGGGSVIDAAGTAAGAHHVEDLLATEAFENKGG